MSASDAESLSIEQLEGDIARLREREAQLDKNARHNFKAYEKCNEGREAAEARIAELEAAMRFDPMATRIRELEAALRKVADNAESWHGPGAPGHAGHADALAVIAAVARAALDAKEEG